MCVDDFFKCSDPLVMKKQQRGGGGEIYSKLKYITDNNISQYELLSPLQKYIVVH